MANERYEALRVSLEQTGTGQMTVHGQSMTPIIQSGSLITFEKRDQYQVGDAVFARVNGRDIDCHLITKTGADGRHMISNNHGHDNGWASTVYGKAVRAEIRGAVKELP